MTTARTRFWLLVLLGGVGAITDTTIGHGQRTDSIRASIDADCLMVHVKQLASDEFEGRAPGTDGEVRTLDYIIGQLRAWSRVETRIVMEAVVGRRTCLWRNQTSTGP